jgi:hypothetical protein
MRNAGPCGWVAQSGCESAEGLAEFFLESSIPQSSALNGHLSVMRGWLGFAGGWGVLRRGPGRRRQWSPDVWRFGCRAGFAAARWRRRRRMVDHGATGLDPARSQLALLAAAGLAVEIASLAVHPGDDRRATVDCERRARSA